MAPQVEHLPHKPDGLNSIHIKVYRDNWPTTLSSELHTHAVAHVCVYTHTHHTHTLFNVSLMKLTACRLKSF